MTWWGKKISKMTNEEAKAARKKLYANNTGPQRNTTAFLNKRADLDKRIEETSLHTGFQTQKVW